jgi:hypothetical protein
VRDHLRELLGALRARGNLRTQIGEVLLDVSHRVTAGLQDRSHLGVEEPAVRNELHVVEQDAPSSTCDDAGGIDPGVMPPMSA